MEKYYQSLNTQGEVEINGEPAFEVDAKSDDGYSNTLFFSKDSGRLIATKSTVYHVDGAIENTTYLSEFKTFGDILLATKIHEINAQSETVITINEVSFEEIPDADFEPPADIKQRLLAE